jgi:uncharacterized damage-inducible protein DinB
MKKQVLSTLENSRNYTLSVANAMDAGKYNTRPTKDVWEFGELMNHIGYGIRWWESNFIRQVKMEWEPPNLSTKKPDVIEWLESSYHMLEQTIQKADLSEEVLHGFHATMDHITHHRGQAIIHLRSQVVTPPEYVY